MHMPFSWRIRCHSKEQVMSEPQVLARYDSNSPANRAWSAARRANGSKPAEIRDTRMPLPALEVRGFMMIAFQNAKDRFEAHIMSGNLFASYAEDVTMDLFRTELRRLDDLLGIPAGIEDW